MKISHFGKSRVTSLLLLMSVGAACGGEREAGAATLTDSAGVVIVNNTGIPTWPEGHEWLVEQEPELSIGTLEGDSDYELFQVQGAVRMLDDAVVVLSSGSKDLRMYDATGQYVWSAGGEGGGPGEFQFPGSIFLLGTDTLLVWDRVASRMSLFGRDGTFARSFLMNGSSTRYSLSAMYDDGNVLVSVVTALTSQGESGLRRDPFPLFLFNLDGDSLAHVGNFPGPEFFVKGGSISVLTFGRRTHLAVHGDMLYLGTNDSYAVDLFDRDGRVVRSMRRQIAPNVVTDEMFDRENAAGLEGLPEQFRERMRSAREGMPKPEFLPFYSKILVDSDGYLWIRDFSSTSEPRFSWTVFDPDGQMLGAVEFPEGLEVYEIGPDYVLGKWLDEADVEYVRVHRLTKN